MARQYSPVERLGINAVEKICLRHGWIFREQSTADFGIDAHIEICNDGRPTGRLVALQIKSGDSWFSERTPAGFRYRGLTRHLNYWEFHSLPVLLVLYSPSSDQAWWCALTPPIAERKRTGWSITVPHNQIFDESSLESIRDIAHGRFMNRRRLEEIARRLRSKKKLLGRFATILDVLQSAQSHLAVMTPTLDQNLFWTLSGCARRVHTRLITGQTLPDDITTELRTRDHSNLKLRMHDSVHAKLILVDHTLAIFSSATLRTRSWRNPFEHAWASAQQPQVGIVSDDFECMWRTTTPASVGPA